MAKYEEASKGVENIFFDVRDNTGIPQWVEFKVLSNNKQKDVCKLVKSNEIYELVTDGINFIVVINETIFGGLPTDMKKIVIDECLAGIRVNDSDVISIEKPDFNTYSGLLQKYGDEKIIRLHESIKSLYDVEKNKEEKEKEERIAKRKEKKLTQK